MSKNEQLLAYIIEKNPYVSITSLMKIPYLIDLSAKKKLNKKISKFEFIRYFYGPFSEEVYKVIEKLLKDGTIKSETRYTVDTEYHVYSLSDNSKSTNTDLLNKKELDIIDAMLDALAGHSAKVLTDIAYKTKPMTKLNAKIGGVEGLNKLLI